MKNATTETKKAAITQQDNVPERREFGSIRQKSDHCFECQYRHNGVRYSFTAQTYDEGAKKLDQIKLEVDRDTLRVDSTMHLSDWLTHWLNAYVLPTTSVSTYSQYSDVVNKHVIPKLGKIPLNKLTVDILQKFFNEKAVSGRLDGKEGGLSTKTLRNMRSTLNEAFLQAIINNKMSFNPISGLRLRKATAPDIRVLTLEEQEAMERTAEASTKVNTLGIAITLNTGLRLGEVLGLQWSAIHLSGAKPFIEIKRQLVREYKTGKLDADSQIVREGEKTSLVLKEVLKTSASRRKLPITKRVVEYFKKILEWQKEMQPEFGSTYNPLGFVFVSELGDVFDPRTYTDIFYRTVKSAGIESANFHCLRHTYATRLAEKGVDAATIARLLGHENPSFTLDRYTHSTDDQLFLVVDGMNPT